MTTDPNELVGGEYKRAGEIEQRVGGLTKREHMALEFAKARIGNTEMFKRHGVHYTSVAEDAVMWADALIDRLNGKMPVQQTKPPETEN